MWLWIFLVFLYSLQRKFIPIFSLSALHLASREGNVLIVHFLIGRSANIEAIDSHGNTPLQLASREGHLLIAQFLVEKGAKLDAKDFLGMTALHYAAMNNHLLIVQFLIEKGAKIQNKSQFGNTAIDYAKLNHHFRIVQYLEQRGAQSVASSNQGQQHNSSSGRSSVLGDGSFEILMLTCFLMSTVWPSLPTKVSTWRWEAFETGK